VTRLDLRLLGPFRAFLDGMPVTGFSAMKVRGLLAYLAMDGEREYGREALAGLLWPDEAQEIALANLRQALANLRQVLGDRTAAAPLLSVGRESVGFARDANYWVDAVEFASLVDQCRKHGHRRVEACEECLARLLQARDLYRGDFLVELFVNESPEFEEWALLKREALRQSFFFVLSALAEHYLLSGNYEEARVAAARQLETDPWQEEAHQQLMRVYAGAGNRSAALAQFEACRRILAAEFGAEPSDATRSLFEQIRSGDSMKGTPAILHNWPAGATPLIGRKRELAELARLLQNPAIRLVTVTGLGGAGKSRLVAEAGGQLAYGFGDGACFVQLSGTSAPAEACHIIAAALGVQLSNHIEPLAELVRLLRDREMLLILDNSERSLGHDAVVLSLVAGCPRLTILAAASEELGLAGEWLLPLDGLRLSGRVGANPMRGDPFAVDARDTDNPTQDDEAVALFIDRMQRAGHGSSLTAADLAAIQEICERVGGLPLAIELAAAWVPVLSCADIVAELSRSQRFLDVQQPDPSRTLSAIIDHAWRLLPPREQHVYQQLAVFEDGFRRAEALAIIDRGSDKLNAVPHPIDASLRLLVRRSLLRVTPSGRYRLHPLLRGFAAERLAERPDLEAAVRVRHSATYLSLLIEAGPALKSSGQEAVLAELVQEVRNLEAAWRHALNRGTFDLIRPAIEPLSLMLDLQSRSQDAFRLFEEATEAVECDAERGDPDEGLLAALLSEAGMQAYRLHNLTAARTLFDRSLVLAPEDEMSVRALALHGLGNTLFWQGDVEGAQARYTEALELAHRAGDEWRAGSLTYLLGDCDSVRGNHAGAMARYEEALSLFRGLGGPRMIAVALSNLGDGYRRQGLLSESKAMYAESLAISESIGHRRLQANNLNGLGEASYDEGDLAAAAGYFAASLKICTEIGSHSLGNLNLTGLAHVACRQGDPRKARMYLREAIRSISDHAGWAILPVAVTSAAHILAAGDQQDRLRAVALLAQVLCHPITWEDYRNRAMRLFIELQVDLPDEAVAAALSQPVPVRAVMQELLAFELPEDAPKLEETGCMDWVD
jgi:DNA-binding SARP family transcriptional activator/predicted ATPase